MSRKAIYPGSFDPCTLAHIDIVRRAAAVFDTVYVGVLTNTLKKPVFTPEERVYMFESALKAEGLSNCKAVCFEGLLVELAKSLGACAVIRGLRNSGDFDSELMMRDMNSLLDPDLQTVFFTTSPEYRAISSSAVREIGLFGGDISGLVHKSVLKMIKERLVQQ